MAHRKMDIDVDAYWDEVLAEIEDLKAAGTIPATTRTFDTKISMIKSFLKQAIAGNTFHYGFEYYTVPMNNAKEKANSIGTFGAQFAAYELIKLVATDIAACTNNEPYWSLMANSAGHDAEMTLRHLAGTYPYPAH